MASLPLTYRSVEEGEADKTEKLRLLHALDAQHTALRRDEAGAWCINGNKGCVYTWGAPGRGWLLTALGCETVRQWSEAKKRLTFCRVTQDGDEEGCLHLAQLPTPDQADAIRKVLGIRKRKTLSEAHRLKVTQHGYKSRFQRRGGDKTPSRTPTPSELAAP